MAEGVSNGSAGIEMHVNFLLPFALHAHQKLDLALAQYTVEKFESFREKAIAKGHHATASLGWEESILSFVAETLLFYHTETLPHAIIVIESMYSRGIAVPSNLTMNMARRIASIRDTPWGSRLAREAASGRYHSLLSKASAGAPLLPLDSAPETTRGENVQHSE